MYITSAGLSGGKFAGKYGKNGGEKNAKGKATCSIPFAIHQAPDKTVSFALLFEDKDAIPVCGFSWIHWTLCNLKETELLENASAAGGDFIQGCTSFCSVAGNESRQEATGYGGMAPPDAPHLYELHIYALDCTLDLEEGFYYNQMAHAMRGHILAHATLSGLYDA